MPLIPERSRHLIQRINRLCERREVRAIFRRLGHGGADALEELDVLFAVVGVGAEEDVFVE